MPFNVINKSVLKLKKVFQYRKIGDAKNYFYYYYYDIVINLF